MANEVAADPGRRTTGQGVTIYEVAERAGVSIATVSHALNRPERVAEHTRRRVIDTAEELGFVSRGRGRAVRALRRIAVSGPFSTHPSYLPRMLEIVQCAPEVDVVVVDDSPGGGDPVLDRLEVRGPLDGVVLMGAEPTERLADELAGAGVPVVLVDHPSTRYTSVTVNDAAGGALVADHLLDAGARRVAWVSPAPPESGVVTTGELRLRGFTGRLAECGYRNEVPWIICDDSIAGGRAAATELATVRADAVFALHDVIAAGVAAGLAEAGLRVPEDVQVVGYDDVDIAELAGLTTVHQPLRETGAIAMELLRALRADPSRPVAHVTLIPELVVRGTTRPGAADG
ncbi:MAG: LacI family DNA-binding transcriptional regulator [Protaetiibacter sp.]